MKEILKQLKLERDQLEMKFIKLNRIIKDLESLDSKEEPKVKKISPKEKGVLKKQRKKRKNKYSDELKETVKNLYGKMPYEEMAEQVSEEFDQKITATNLKNLVKNHGWKKNSRETDSDPKPEPVEKKPFHKRATQREEIKILKEKTKNCGLPSVAIKLIQECYVSNSDQELRQIIADRTGAYHSIKKIHEYREKEGLLDPTDPSIPMAESEDEWGEDDETN